MKGIQEIFDKIKKFRNYYVSVAISAFIPFVFGCLYLFVLSFIPKSALYYCLVVCGIFILIGITTFVIFTNTELYANRAFLLKELKSKRVDENAIVLLFENGEFVYNMQRIYLSSSFYNIAAKLFEIPKELSVREEQTYFNVADNKLYSIFFVSKLIIYIMVKKCTIFIFLLLNFILFTLIMVKFIKILYGIV